MKKGFTLIELMIVVAIIAVIAAIAIPNLMQSRIQANETNALAAMKAYAVSQSTFIKGAYSIRGNAGTFTADVAGYTPNKTTYVDAKTKRYAYPYSDLYNISDNTTANGPLALIARPFANAIGSDTAWNGYVFGQGEVTSANPNTFDMYSMPALYAQSGNNCFYINQQGAVRQRDLGAATKPAPAGTPGTVTALKLSDVSADFSTPMSNANWLDS